MSMLDTPGPRAVHDTLSPLSLGLEDEPSPSEMRFSALPYSHQNHRLLPIISHARERLRPERRPALAFQDLAFPGRLDEQIPRGHRHFLEPVHIDQPRSHIEEERLEI